MTRTLAVVSLLGIGSLGCSLVYDPSSHMGGGMDAGRDGGGRDGGADGGRTDAATDARVEPDAGTDAGPEPIALSDFCSVYAETYCDSVEACCSMIPATWTRAQCLTDTENGCERYVGPAAVSGVIDYDPVLAAVAVAEARAYIDACSLELFDWAFDRQGFFRPLVGSIPSGEVCTPDPEPGPFDDVGTVVAILSCADGAICQKVAPGDWRCLNPGGAGTRCDTPLNCAQTVPRCVRMNAASPTVCGAGEPEGSGCSSGFECLSLRCTGPAFNQRCEAPSRDAAYCPPS
ncbi:MAG: hypothetical protein AB7S26_40455 [Sandaracinaceae bacterium]